MESEHEQLLKEKSALHSTIENLRADHASRLDQEAKRVQDEIEQKSMEYSVAKVNA